VVRETHHAIQHQQDLHDWQTVVELYQYVHEHPDEAAEDQDASASEIV